MHSHRRLSRRSLVATSSGMAAALAHRSKGRGPGFASGAQPDPARPGARWRRTRRLRPRQPPLRPGQTALRSEVPRRHTQHDGTERHGGVPRHAGGKGEGTPDIFWPEIEIVQELGKTGVLLDVTDIVEEKRGGILPGQDERVLHRLDRQVRRIPGRHRHGRSLLPPGPDRPGRA